MCPDLDVAANISLCSLPQATQWGCVHRAKEDLLVTESVSATGVKTPSIHASITGLSGGNQQKVVLAKWLEGNADIFIFDEPTRGIDVGAKYEIYLLINALVARGKSILLISSELPEVIGMSDRILVMKEGKVMGEIEDAQSTSQETVLALALKE